MSKNTIEAIISLQNFDIMEENENVVYLGFFSRDTEETDENNCMILRIETIDNITTRKFALGINYDKKCTWSQRANYSYHYALKNL